MGEQIERDLSRARLWSAHYREKLQHISCAASRSAIGSNSSGPPRWRAQLPDTAVEAALVRVARLMRGADGHPVHHLRPWIFPRAAWVVMDIPPMPSTTAHTEFIARHSRAAGHGLRSAGRIGEDHRPVF
jgi:hypothetical protein